VHRFALALTACLALVAAACASEADENPLTEAGSNAGDENSTDTSGSTDGQGGGADGTGTLDWQECGGGAECATLDVPVDYFLDRAVSV